MADIAEALTRKLGPFPVWVWGVGAGVGINVGRHFLDKRKATAEAEAAAAIPADTYTEQTGGGSAGVPPPFPNSGSWAASGGAGGNPAPADDSPQSNAAWLAKAVEWLSSQGRPFGIVDSALQKYLAGHAINAAEEGIVGSAIAYLGYPPEGAPPILRAPAQGNDGGSTPPPAPPTPPAPTQPAPPAPAQIVNFGAEGGPGWTAFLYEGGKLRWIQDGNEYARLRDSGLQRIDLGPRAEQTAYLSSVSTAGPMPYTLTGEQAAAWQAGQA